MAGSWRLWPSDWGSSTKGVRNEGMLPKIEGRAWIERVPLAYIRSKVKLCAMSESRKGVIPPPRQYSDHYFLAEARRVLGRHALEDEKHDVASREVDRGAVGGLVHGGEELCKPLRREVVRRADPLSVARGAQDAEGVAQDEVRPGVVRGVERGVGERDRTRRAREAAPHAGDAEPCAQHEQQRRADVAAPPLAQQGRLLQAAAVTAGQQGGEQHGREHEVPVLRGELQDQCERVVVVGEEDLVGREALLRVTEVDRVGEVRRHDEHGVHRHVVAVEQRPPPALRADACRQR